MGLSDGRLQLGRLICEGCSGLVLYGTFQGQPAVYKLFGPDTEGVAAGINEARMYRESHLWYRLLIATCFIVLLLAYLDAPLFDLLSNQITNSIVSWWLLDLLNTYC